MSESEGGHGGEASILSGEASGERNLPSLPFLSTTMVALSLFQRLARARALALSLALSLSALPLALPDGLEG